MKRLEDEQKFSRRWRDDCLNDFAGFAEPGLDRLPKVRA